MINSSLTWPFSPCTNTVDEAAGQAECCAEVGHCRAKCVDFDSTFVAPSADTKNYLNTTQPGCMCDTYHYISPGGWGSGPSVFDPRLGCEEPNPMQFLHFAIGGLVIIFALCVTGYGAGVATTIYRRIQESGKRRSGCWCFRGKMLPGISSCIVGLLALAADMIINMISGQVKKNCLKADCLQTPEVAGQIAQAVAMFFMLVTWTSVAVQWVQVASNAKVFRRTTPAAARWRAKAFVWGIRIFSVTQVVILQLMNQYTLSYLIMILTALFISATYMVGATRLLHVLQAAQPESRSGSARASGQLGRFGHASVDGRTSSNRATSWLRKSARLVTGKGGGGSTLRKRTQRASLIWQTARQIMVSCICCAASLALFVASMFFGSLLDFEAGSSSFFWGTLMSLFYNAATLSLVIGT